MLLTQILFWPLVALHLWKGVNALVRAEALERARRANADLERPWRGVTKMLVGALLYLPGFFYARLPYLWLLLSLATFGAGMFALSIAAGVRQLGMSAPALIPESDIPRRASRRRLSAMLEFAIVLVWAWAWRHVVA